MEKKKENQETRTSYNPCLLRKNLVNKSKASGITLIALVITTIFSYDEKLKCSNNKGFLLETI